MVLLSTALLLLAGCVGGPERPTATADPLAPFKKMAKDDQCAGTRNRLFLIDGELVFWDSAGACSDAAFAEVLYGSTPDRVLCRFHDSIAGPAQECPDASYQDLFETIVANLDKPDLGLGPAHTVRPVEF